MSERKHTPGPWSLNTRTAPRRIELKRTHWEIGGGPQLKGVAIIFGDTDANARLIAAAPDLLEALLEARNEVVQVKVDLIGARAENFKGAGDERFDQVSAHEVARIEALIARISLAINKATGSTP